MLDKLKSKLKITWDDEDKLLLDILNQGKYYFETVTAAEIDFKNNLLAETLLMDYARYSYNNSLEYFEENFKSQILSLQFEVIINEKNKVPKL